MSGGMMSEMDLPAPRFDTSFQRGVLKIALSEDYFASQLVRYLALDKEVKKLNIFNTKQLQIIFDCISKSMAEYKTHPSDAQVRQYISEFAPEEQVELLSTYESILGEDTHDEEYFRRHLESFVQQVKMAVGFYKVREAWKSDRFETPDVMQAVIDGIRRVKFEKEDILTLNDIEQVTSDAQNMLAGLIPTGLAPLDKDLMGGLPRESFTAVLGGTNAGKSLFVISLGANAIRQGKKVLHVALEGMRNEALMRYTSNLTGVPIRGMIQNNLTPLQKEQLSRAKQYENNLKIHNMLGFGVTVEDLAAKCREIFKEYKFDMLIVDYSQILETRQKTEGARHVQAYVHRALSSMAREFNCVVVSPVQATRNAQKDQTAYKSKKDDLDLPILRSSDISESFEIARVAAVIITLNRTDEESKEGKLRIFLEKQRLEEKNKLYGVITKFAYCQLITDETYDPTAIVDTASIFDEDNSPQNTSMNAAIQRREMDDRQNLRKKINDLIGQQYSINSSIMDAMKNAEADADSMSDEDRTNFQNWVEAEEAKKVKIIEEIKGSVALYYPGSTPELYKMAKESLSEVEKSGTAPISAIKEHKEKVRHLSYLFDRSSSK